MCQQILAPIHLLIANDLLCLSTQYHSNATLDLKSDKTNLAKQSTGVLKVLSPPLPLNYMAV